MVEAGGIEPPSGQASMQTYTCFSGCFSTPGSVYPVFPGVRALFQPPMARDGIACLSKLSSEFLDPQMAVSALHRFGVKLPCSGSTGHRDRSPEGTANHIANGVGS